MSVTDIVIPRSRPIEVVCNNANLTKFYLPIDQVLQTAAEIIAVEAWRVSDVTNGPISGAALQSDAVFKNSFLTLITVEGNTERLSQIPLQSLNTALNAGLLKKLMLPQINVNACYISVPSAAGLVANQIWYLNFYYRCDGDIEASLKTYRKPI